MIYTGIKWDVKTYGGQTSLISDFNRVSNKGLSWSISKEVNYGIDLELFNRRVFVNGDIYSKYISGTGIYFHICLLIWALLLYSRTWLI